MMWRRRVLPAVLLIVAGCGLSNAMYNARRRLDDGDRAIARGDTADARTAYLDAIERAANVVRDEDEDGDDRGEALYLVARARTALGEHAAAAAALRRLLETATEAELRARAHAWLGGALVALDDHAAAAPHLDSALVGLDDRELEGRARLWRARIRFAAADEGAWDDLSIARAAGGTIASAARVEAVGYAVHAGDSALAREAFRDLIADEDAAPSADSIAAFALIAAERWGANKAHALLDGATRGHWPPATRDSILLVRAEIAARVDPALGIAEALALADRAGSAIGDVARLRAARWSLRTATSPEALDEVRAMLLPAVTSADVVSLLGIIRTIDVLDDRGRDRSQVVALFAAAELARDELGAPALAARLFRDYAAADPDAVWAPKALLAAALLDPGSAASAAALERVLTQHADNPYVAAWKGKGLGSEAFAEAEERLARTLATVSGAAATEATGRDVQVGRAVAVLDSLRAAARADTVRAGCVALVDSLAVAGIRADSVRAACLRGDSERIAIVLTMDTLLLRDTTAVHADSLSLRRQRQMVIDTTIRRAP